MSSNLNSPFTPASLSNSKRGVPTVGLDANMSEEVLKDLEYAFSTGATDRIACDYAGISAWTFRQWRAYSDMQVEPYATAMKKLAKVLAKVAIDDLETIGKHAKSHWRAAAFRIERRFPGDFGAKSEITIGSPMQRELVEMVAAGIISVEDVHAQMPNLPASVSNAIEPYRRLPVVEEEEGVIIVEQPAT